MKSSGFRRDRYVTKLTSAHDNLRVLETAKEAWRQDFDQLNKNFGNEMRRYMDENNIGLRKLARAIKKSSAYVSDIRLGRRHAPSELRVEIMRTLKDL